MPLSETTTRGQEDSAPRGFKFPSWAEHFFAHRHLMITLLGVRTVLEHLVICFINSLCHFWDTPARKTDDTSPRKVWKNRHYMGKMLTVMTVHVLSVMAPFHFTWRALSLALVLYPVVALSVTLSYHRNLAHRSFLLPKWLEYSFAYIAMFSFQGHPIDWVSTHRYHHQFADTDRDPHSPLEGFWFSHFIWIFDTDYIRQKCGGRNNVGDLKRQRFYRFLQRTMGFHLLAVLAIIYLWGGFPCIAWSAGVATAFGYHVTFLINSVCHLWGSRAWNTNDTSRNVWWLSIVTMGESWHNNHHAFEYSARHGMEWWQIDFTWYLIRALESLGLATHVKYPSLSRISTMMPLPP